MKIQCQSSDIISTLPQSIIENILILMPIRDAVRTSILSRKWRSCWMTIPKLVFHDKLVEVPSNLIHLKEYTFVSVIFNVLLLHSGPLLEFEYVGEIRMDYGFDQILLYLSRNKIVKKFIFKISSYYYKLPSSFFSLQGLESLELTNCILELPSTFDGFSRLKSLCFICVEVTSKVFQSFLSNCPVLMDVTLDGFQEELVGENKFTFVELLKCVPLIRTLDILECYMEDLAAGGMPQKLPTPLVHLKNLILELYLTDYVEISSTLSLLRNAPNLEKICFTMYEKLDTPHISVKCFDFQDYSSFNLDHLKELKMICYENSALELEFVKLIMAKSPKLEKALIELNDSLSIDEELKIREDLIRLPVPHGSASTKLIIERA